MLSRALTASLHPVKMTCALGLLALTAGAGCDSGGTTGGDDMAKPMSDLAPAIRRYGLVRLGSSTYTTGGGSMIKSSGAVATFVDPTIQGGGCERTVSTVTGGSCSLYRCTGASFIATNPGKIIASVSGSPVATLTPRNDGSYPVFGDDTQSVFPIGSAVTVAAAGNAAAPAWTTDVTFSSAAFTLTNPNPAPIQLSATVSTKSDFVPTWQALAAGSTVTVELSQATDTNKGLYLSCQFDGTKGTGTVPAALTKSFAVTQGQQNFASLWIGPSVSKTVTSSDWQVEIVALGAGRTGLATISDQ